MGPIEFSKEALEAFKNQLEKASGVRAIRLGVRGGSCNGMQYVIEFDYGPKKPEDVEWYPPDIEYAAVNVTFRIDEKSAALLSGSTVTWRKSLMRDGFEFENPNEASRCGCGKSFSPK